MDKNGDYQLVHGPKLRKIKADNIKILFSGHGSKGLKTIGENVCLSCLPNSLLWLDHLVTEQQHNVCP
jgi:hypothetical protein